MALDLADSAYEWQGKRLFESLCEGSASFETLMQSYSKHRELVLSLCKSEKLQLLDSFFDELLGQFPGKTPRIAESELVDRIENCKEELGFLRNPSTRLFSIEDDSLLVFSCPRKRISRIRLTQSFAVKHSSMILLEDSSLFCCGGLNKHWLRESYSSETCIVTMPNIVSRQANMLESRSYHGLALCKGHIYAIGGIRDNLSHRRCEKFSIDGGNWLELPQYLAYSHSYFTPLVYNEKIYVLGGANSKGEVIDSINDDITTLSIGFLGLGACVSLFISHNSALILSENGSLTVDFDSLQSQENAGAKGIPWSSYPAVIYEGEVYAADKDRAFYCLSLQGNLKGKFK
jgi:hypothetical protein